MRGRPIILQISAAVTLPDLEVTPVLYYLLLYKGILYEHIYYSNKFCAWAADKLTSLDILFLSVVE